MKYRKSSVPEINLSEFTDRKSIQQYGFPQSVSPYNSIDNSNNSSPYNSRVKSSTEVRKQLNEPTPE